MKFGVREICDVVLKAKAAQKIGNRVFYKNEPVIYFDSLKTSSLEGQSTTVYAQGGRGNSRLIGWDGERTVTFTMEDALISPAGVAILTGAGLIEPSENNSIKMHVTERIELQPTDLHLNDGYIEIKLSEEPYIPGRTTTTITEDDETTTTYSLSYPATAQDFIYVMFLKNDEPISEPFIPSELTITAVPGQGKDAHDYKIKIVDQESSTDQSAVFSETEATGGANYYRKNKLSQYFDVSQENIVLVDYYVERTTGAFEIDITPDKFGGNFYLEASTLFRDTNGIDLPAEFVIPNCKVQSNFTFTMASSGDPSTFTFTMDAFPDYTRWNKTKKVLAAIQVLDTSTETLDFKRLSTPHDYSDDYAGKQAQFIEI